MPLWNLAAPKTPAATAQKTSVLRALASLIPGAVGQESHFRLDQFASVIEQSCWLFSAVYRIANVLAATRWRVIERGTNRLAKGKAATDLRNLLEDVNEDDTDFDFKQGLFVHMGLDGEWAAHKARDGLGKVRQIHLLQPQHFRLLPDPSGQRRIGGMRWWGAGTDIAIPRSEFVYCRSYHPNSHLRGMSPTAPLLRELKWDLAAARFNMALIAEGMRLGGILMPKEGFTPNEDEWNALKAELRKNNMGERNAGRFLALNAPFDFKADGMVPADMEMTEGRKMIRDMTGSVEGAAPMMMMNYDAASYANSEAQIKQFWHHVGQPMLMQASKSINQQMVREDFGEDIEVVPDYAGIDAQIDSEKTRVETTGSLLLGGLISIDEARERMGMDPLPDGNGAVHVLQGANVVFKPGEWRNLIEEKKEPKPEPGVGGASSAPSAMPSGEEQARPERRAASALARMNGEAGPLLGRLTGDFDLWRHDVAESTEPIALELPGVSGETRIAVLKAIEELSGGSRPRLDDPAVRSLLRRCDAVAKDVQAESVAGLGDVRGADAIRARCMDPKARARQVLAEISEALVAAADSQ